MKVFCSCLFFWTLSGFSQFDIGETSIVFNDTERDRDIETFIYYPATESGEDVTVTDGKFPVISVGHGFVMTYESYAYIWEHFVPLGYIVILPNTETTVTVSHGDFGTDLSFVIGAIQTEGATEGSLFFEHVSMTSAVLGHSMGGGAAVLAAAEDTEISTLVTLAAAETDPSAIDVAETVLQPSLTFAGGVDCVTPIAEHQEPVYENLSDCKGYVFIPEGSHCQFANSNVLCELGEFSCTASEISEEEQHETVLEALTPWFQAFLKMDYAAWEEVEALEGAHDLYDLELECDDNGPVLSVENSVANDAVIYPNPTTGEVWIPANFQNKSYSIYSADGRLVRGGKTKKSIDLSNLETGVYLIELRDDSGNVLVNRIQKL